MAAVSAETQEILDRLKKEGELLRNRGKHSIKSVKIDMAKFEGVFDTIALNLAEQTEILRESLGIERDRVADEIRRRDLEEVKSVSANKAAEPESNVATTERSGGVARLLTETLGSVASGLGSLAIKGALGLAAGFALYQFAKGFINTKAGDPDFVDNFIDDTIVAIKNFKNEVIARAPSVLGGALDTMEKVKGQIEEFGEGLGGWKTTIDGVKETFTNGEDGIVERIDSMVDDAKTEFDKVKTSVTETINKTSTATTDAITRITGEEGVISKVESFIETTTTDVKTTIDEAKTSVGELSKSLMDTSGTMNKVNNLFKFVNFEELQTTFTRLSNELPKSANKVLDFFSNPLAAILPPLTAGLITGAVAKQTGKAIAGLKPEYRQTGTINPAMNLKTAVIGAVGVGIGVFGGRLKDWILGADGMGNVDVENVSVGRQVAAGAVDVIGAAAQGATIGAMFGPTGMLVGAVIGATLSLGKKLYDWFQRKKREWGRQAEIEAAAIEQRAAMTPSQQLIADYQAAKDTLATTGGGHSGRNARRRAAEDIKTLESMASSQGMSFSYKGGDVSLVQNNSSGGSAVEVNNNAGSGPVGSAGDPVYGVQ